MKCYKNKETGMTITETVAKLKHLPYYNEEKMIAKNWYPIEFRKPIYDSNLYTMVPREIYFEDNKYVQEFELKELDEETKQLNYNDRLEERKQFVREERNRLLAETDFYFLADYPLDNTKKEKIIAYRQALRDLTSDYSFPWLNSEIPWPVKDF